MRPDGNYIAVTGVKDLINLCKEWSLSPTLAVDTETTGLDVLNDHLLGLSVTVTPGVGYWIPVDKSQLPDVEYQLGMFEPEQNITIPQIQKYVGPLLSNPRIKKYVHNIKFDIPLLRRYKMPIVNYMDTMLAAWVLGNQKGRRYGLKAISKEKFDIIQPDLFSLFKRYKSFQGIPLDLATEYAGADSDMTFRLGDLLDTALERFPSLIETLVMEQELALVLWENEQTGILVDESKLLRRAEDLGADMEVAREDFHEASKTDPKLFNIASNPQVKDLLKRAAKGFDVTSVSEEVLKIADSQVGIPWIEPLLDYRAHAKTKSTFVEGIYNRIRKDGRLETSFRQAGIATGRLSSRNPNLQNIPKEYRDVFIVKPNHYMVAIDFSGMELRILADLANEERMIEAFNGGTDVHSMTASLIFDIPYDEVGKKSKERAAAKTVGFGLCLHPDTLVITNKGDMSIKDVQVGDVVLSHTGSWQKVDTKNISYHETLLKIKTSNEDERPVYASKDHKFLKKGTVDFWTAAKDLRVGDLLYRISDSMSTRIFTVVEEIVSIEDVNHGDNCYDIGVANDHSFFANGLITHNCYGMSEFKLARTLDISIDEAKRLLDKYFSIFTGVRNYMSSIHYHLMQHGWVENAYGRRRYFPVLKYAHDQKMLAAFKREAGNFPIQSLNAEITKRSLIKIHRFLTDEDWETKQISSIHDEIIWEVHAEEMQTLVPRFVQTMENIYQLKVPTIAEIGLGKTMSEACLDEENWELYLKGEYV